MRCRWLSRETQDSLLTAFAGKLLALAGPLDPSTIAFKHICSPQTHPIAATTTAGATSGGSSDAASLTTMIAAALQLMSDYLVDPDVVVIKSAQFTLRNLIPTQLGQDALTLLSPVTQSYLQVQTCSRTVCARAIPIDWNMSPWHQSVYPEAATLNAIRASMHVIHAAACA